MKPCLRFFALLLLCGCAHAPQKLEGIPLLWKPTSSIEDFADIDLNGIMDVKIQVDRFSDTRKDPALIAENHEDPQPKSVTTRDDVATYVSDNMRDTLRRVGLDVVDTGGQVVIGGEIRGFFVTETHTYHGEIVLRVSVHDAAGKVLWSGIANGDATRFGRSYKAGEYYEVLSDALMDTTHDLLADPTFRAAITRK